ncbi:MAG: hypothetical protein U9Q15_03045 [Patescibacteria group bacterium]|nr:hypothetical protein [Patescibacteria group bacterium]
MERLIKNYYLDIIQYPEDIHFSKEMGKTNKETLILHCHPDDTKKIIGPRGIAIRSLRKLLELQYPQSFYSLEISDHEHSS